MTVKKCLSGSDTIVIIPLIYNSSMRRRKWSSAQVSLLVYLFFLLDFLIVFLWGNRVMISQDMHSTDVSDQVKFLLWTQDNPLDYDLVKVGDISGLIASHFNKDLPTKILIHGYDDTGTTGWVLNVRNEYLKKDPVNVISVDWRDLATTYPFYNIAAANTKPVGYLTADLIEFLCNNGANLTDFHPVGFSLGAQVAGHLGYKLDGQLSRITGLDPAGFMFHSVPPSERLDQSDADLVDVVHTAGLWIGTDEPVGHVDFYPNAGHHPQPGCEDEGLGLDCSHQRAHKLFAESINSHVGFLSFQCDSYLDFSTGKCNLGQVRRNEMGEPTESVNKGIFYLRTYSKSPFAIPQMFLYPDNNL